MHVNILGKRYRLVFVPRLPSERRGDCDAPHIPGKQIRIQRKLSGEEELEVICHEVWHAADWSKDEEFISDASQDLARILWRLGYRRARVEDDSA